VILRLDRPDLLGDLDLLILTKRLRFLTSAREPWESASEDECLRRRSLIGLRELLGDRRRRRGGVRERDRDTLGGGELGLSFFAGDIEREVFLGNLLLSLLGDQDLSRLRRGGGDLESRDGDRRARRGGGDLERLDEGDLRARRRGEVLERSEEGERRVRRGGGEAERLPEGERRRSRDLSRRPPRPRLRPLLLPGTYMSRSRRGGGDLRRLHILVLARFG
jgi:hypothetical protein